MEHLYEKASASAAYLKEQLRFAPRIAVVLGSGLGDLTAGFTDTREIPYADIPHFPQSTVAGHKGALLEGKLGDTPVLAMEGRFHFYEGYTMKEVCYPFYVFKLLGIETVVLTNAAGGINRSFEPGTLMLITDTINMMGTNPLIGPNDERFGPRFPDMTEIFSHDLLDLARSVADRQGIAFACQVQVPRELSVDEADLCTLLVNLLDNALEACEQIPEKGRFLRVYLAVNGRQLYMSIQNSAKEELNFNERNYITQKRGSHGFGMKRVSAVVEKYDGFLNLANEPGIFAAEVTLPLAG